MKVTVELKGTEGVKKEHQNGFAIMMQPADSTAKSAGIPQSDVNLTGVVNLPYLNPQPSTVTLNLDRLIPSQTASVTSAISDAPRSVTHPPQPMTSNTRAYHTVTKLLLTLYGMMMAPVPLLR